MPGPSLRERSVKVSLVRESPGPDLADQVGVDQDVPRRQVSVNEAHVGQILHPCSDSSEHPHELDGGELTVVHLQREENRVKPSQNLSKSN